MLVSHARHNQQQRKMVMLKYLLGVKEIIMSNRDFHTIQQRTNNQEDIEIRHKLVNVYYL